MSAPDEGAAGPASAGSAPLIRIEGVVKRFGAFTALDGVSLDIGEGEFFALLGPSGCGKTTLLRLLAGFETPDEGRIIVDGVDIAGSPPHRRPVNMMFQSYALFPHLSVAGNIAFGLKREGQPKPVIEGRVQEMLRLVRLEGLGHRKPHQLSGGQRQRVALARALAKRPRLLLLDEPMAALDRKLREETQFELTELQRRLGLTFIVVTHDQQEAMGLAGRIGVMNRGALAQVGPPREVYDRPNSRYVAGFIGDANILEATVEQTDGRKLTLSCPAVGAALAAEAAPDQSPFASGAAVALVLRPERLRLTERGLAQSTEDGVNRLAATISDIAYGGAATLYRLRLASGETLKATEPNGLRPAPLARGADVTVSFAANAGVLIPGAPT